MDYIEALELSLDIKAKKNFIPMQPGDVYKTYADTSSLFEATDINHKHQLKVTTILTATV